MYNSTQRIIRDLFDNCHSCGEPGGAVALISELYGKHAHNMQVVCSKCDARIDHRTTNDKKIITDAIQKNRTID